jgi:hypothetical protein
LEILSTLFDLLKELYNNSHKKKKELFQLFITPAFQDIEKLHENYVETFQNYVTIIEESKILMTENHPVFKQILSDSIFSESIRQRVFSFYDNTNDSIFEPFVTSVGIYCFILIESLQNDDFYVNYLDHISSRSGSSEIQHWMLAYLNSQRYRVYSELFVASKTTLPNKEKKINAMKVIIESLHDLQLRYRGIVDTYNQLKKVCYNS